MAPLVRGSTVLVESTLNPTVKRQNSGLNPLIQDSHPVTQDVTSSLSLNLYL